MSENNLLSANLAEQQKKTISELKQANIEFTQLIQKQVRANKIDGEIIGTGVADFTRDNVAYQFEHNNKEFQLIDVPGIEGDESKFEHMVKAAVAKAHIVFFVNGTAKKPEVGTAKKIKKYLRHGTKLQPIINVRGFADQYEFPEDREKLTNKAIKSASEQTYTVLSNELDQKIVMQPLITQGLLAFCSLAYQNKVSTIHPSREKDLGRIQSKYLEVFSTPSEMLKFSNIHSVVSVLKKKLETIEYEIVESNRVKALTLLNKSILILTCQKEIYTKYVEGVRAEFNLCEQSFNGFFNDFNKEIKRKRQLKIQETIIEIKDKSNEIIESYFGDNDKIIRRIQKIVSMDLHQLSNELNTIFESEVNMLTKRLTQESERLVQNIENVSEMLKVDKLDVGFKGLTLTSYDILSLRNISSWVINIVGYTASGLAVGSMVPFIGNAVGAVLGALIGVLKSTWDVFSSKEKRIRKMQHEMQKILNEKGEDIMESENKIIAQIISNLSEYHADLSIKLDYQFNSIKQPLRLISESIKCMNDVKVKVKDVNYGTV